MAKDFRFPKGVGFPGDSQGPAPGKVFFRGSTPDALGQVIGSELFGENNPGAANARTPLQYSIAPTPVDWEYCLNYAGAPTGGALIEIWSSIVDPGPAPWYHGNYDQFAIHGSNWYFNAICQNGGNDGSQFTSAANSELFITYATRDGYIGDATGIGLMSGLGTGITTGGSGSQDGRTENWVVEDPVELTDDGIRGFVWSAFQVIIGASDVTLRMWYKVGRAGKLWGPCLSNMTFAEMRQKAIDNGMDSARANAWSPSAPTAIEINPQTPGGYVTHARVYALDTEPTIETLEAHAQRNTADTSAWADWPLNHKNGAAYLGDDSGNGRNLTLHGTVAQGPLTWFEDPLTGGTQTTAIIGSGGPIVGGSFADAAKQAQVATGGPVVGGSSVDAAKRTTTSAGGAVTGGTSTRAAKRTTTGSSGSLVGGTAARAYKRASVGSSGAVFGGTSPTASAHTGNTTAIIGSAGPVVGGASTREAKRTSVAVGGSVVGGSATVAFKRTAVATSGAVVSGSAALNRKAAPVGVSGPVVGGSSAIARHSGFTSAAGALVGGISTKAAKRTQDATSGAIVGGVSAKAAKRTTIATAGATVGGASTTARKEAITATSGPIVGGAASYNRKSASTSTRGPVVGGTSPTASHGGTIAVGGAVFGGASPNSSGQPGHGSVIATRGPVVGGSATIACKRIAISSEGAVIGGASATARKSATVATRGILTGGFSPATCKRTVNPTRGALVGGSAATLRHVALVTTAGPTVGGTATKAAKATARGQAGAVFGGSAFQGVPGIAYIGGVPHPIAFGDVMVAGVPRRIVGGWVQVSGQWRAIA